MVKTVKNKLSISSQLRPTIQKCYSLVNEQNPPEETAKIQNSNSQINK